MPVFLRPLYFLCSLTFLFLLAGCERPVQERERAGELLVSIRPLALIAREVAGPEQQITVLIDSGDPHHYAPTVADRARLERAPLVIWMGPQLESVLAKQLQQLPAERQLRLIDAGGYEFSGASPQDLHLWLRPRNAAIMAAHIAERLAALDPPQAETYRGRARDFSRAMANQQKVLERALWAYRDVPIVVTHDAYGHFFGPAGVESEGLADSSFTQRGARTMLELQGKEGGCLFGEAPENDRDRQIAVNLGLTYVALDPLGTRLAKGANYRDLLAQLLEDSRRCLAQVPDRADQ